MASVDQAMRRSVINGEAEWDSSIDQENQSKLKVIVNEAGWPAISKVGMDASHAAWLLVQHAPDLSFMEQCLGLMESMGKDEVNPANVAYLKDRVLMMNGEPQLYGTQFQGSGEQMTVYPIADAEHVDERRASVGLDSFTEYEMRVRKLYKIA